MFASKHYYITHREYRYIQGRTIGFCQGGEIFQAAREARTIFYCHPLYNFSPLLCGFKVKREGGKYLLPSFIMIWFCVVEALHFFENSESQ